MRLTNDHLKDDLLRAYADRENAPQTNALVEAHLERCAACRARLASLRQVEQQVRGHIERLSPAAPHEAPRPAAQAYARLMSNGPIQPTSKVREIPMLRKKSFWTALAVITALVLVFTMTPARAWAGTFLNLFRVQQVQVITFDPGVAEALENQMDANSAAFEQVFKEDLEISERGEAQSYTSVEDAAAAAGFTPRIPTAIENATLMVQPGVDAVLTIDQPKMQELIDLTGVDYTLPESLHGQVVKVEVPDAVVFSSGCITPDTDLDPGSAELKDCLTLAQLPSPSVNAPDELDVPRIGEAVFQLLGYSADEARSLSQRIDWTTTLVLPIPTNQEVNTREVQVDGVTGTMLTEDSGAMLIWVKDGMLYALRSPAGAENAFSVARSLE